MSQDEEQEQDVDRRIVVIKDDKEGKEDNGSEPMSQDVEQQSDSTPDVTKDEL